MHPQVGLQVLASALLDRLAAKLRVTSYTQCRAPSKYILMPIQVLSSPLTSIDKLLISSKIVHTFIINLLYNSV
jgi:hypothetical protein